MKFLLFLLPFFLTAQQNVVKIFDSYSKEPIALANAYYKNLNVGSITNEDGELALKLENDTITISHVNYYTKHFLPSTLENQDTIFLKQKVLELDEVILYNFNLKEQLNNVVDKYTQLYPKNTTYLSTYKETLRINNVISRLAQAQIYFWDKSYKYDIKKSIHNQSEFNLVNTDYAKLPNLKSPAGQGAYLKNNYIIPAFHLNYHISYILELTQDINIEQVSKDSNTTRILFSALLHKDKSIAGKLVNSEIVFENKSGAITYIKLNIQIDGDFSNEFSKKKQIPYKSKTNFQSLELRFRAYTKNKFQLSSFRSDLIGEVKYEGNHEHLRIIQEFLVTESQKGKKTKKSKAIKLDKPFYENFQETKPDNSIILLSKEELAFIKNK